MNQIDRQIMMLMLQTRSDQLSEYRYISRAKFQVIWICFKICQKQSVAIASPRRTRILFKQTFTEASLRLLLSLSSMWFPRTSLASASRPALPTSGFPVIRSRGRFVNLSQLLLGCFGEVTKHLFELHGPLDAFLSIIHAGGTLRRNAPGRNPQTNNSTCSFNIQANRKNRHMQRQEKQESFQKQYSVVLQLSPKHSFSA